MPYDVRESDKCPKSRPWAVIKKATGEVIGCNPSKAAAEKQRAAILANESLMSASSLSVADRVFFLSDGFGIEPKVYSGSNGNKTYSGVAVFRSGTFRDSTGTQNTWEPLHIKQMMDNYDHLKSKNILSSVPARDGHPGWLINNIPGKGAVVGWHDNLAVKTMASPVDGQQYDYLLADYTITEPYAQAKLDNGTWRNRSAEVGGYTTNNESEFWPVYMGFAFVDFPAVEGLNFSSTVGSGGRFYAFLGGTSREITVTQPAQQPAVQPQLPFLAPQPQPAQHAAPTAPVAPAAPVAAPTPFVFSVNGQNVTDPLQVQAYIRQLEQFRVETREAGRRAFVAGLVTSNRLLAPQQEKQTNFALSLTDEQYAAWKANWEETTPSSLLGNHGGGVSNPNNSSQPDPATQGLADAEEIVRQHELSGMSPAELKNTKSYKALVAAGRRSA